MKKLFVHGSYVGDTGYNQHTRDFFRHLSKHSKIKVRNFTVGSTWDGISPEPHNNEPYFNDTDRKLLYEQVLWNADKSRGNYKIYEDPSKDFIPDVNIVLCETNHHLFYDEYHGPKIAYNVWESTLQPEGYFEKLKEFDELWVPSKWQRDCTIAQGYDPNKIKVVPEGVDVNTFYPEETSHELTSDGRFKFFLAGRWDYRKSIKEIIETFLKTFDKDEPVDLIISVDNSFSGDGMKSTEERLEHYGFIDDRIKILHFPPREEYIRLLKSCDAFVSCARSEGWNLPLIESMACGTPSIYSDCSGQLEFAKGRGIPVKIVGEKPVNSVDYNHFNDSVGNYYEPDFDDLGKQMLEVVTNHKSYKQKALEESEEIRKEFNWERVAEIGMETINKFLKNYVKPQTNNSIHILYIDGPRVEIKGDVKENYFIEFIDGEGKVRYSDTISNNMWASCGTEYYIPWTVKINGEVVDKFNIKDKRVYISFESKSLGDTIAWIPYCEVFRKKHGCQLIVSTFLNSLFIDQYPNIKFIEPGEIVSNIHAQYRLGLFYTSEGVYDKNKHPFDFKKISLQKMSTNILGLDYEEVRPLLKLPNVPKKKKVGIGFHSTAQAKYWNNPDAWQSVIDHLNALGYECIIYSKEGDGYMNNHYPKGVTIYKGGNLQEVINDLSECEFFIGLSSGLSWLAWACKLPVILISGFTEKWLETTLNTYRVINEKVCNGCFNSYRFDAGDWNWCPLHKNTDRMFECSKQISSEMVIKEINKIMGNPINDEVYSLSDDSITIVLSHADNEWRKHLLRECIENLDGEIILSSNYPVDTNIQEMCDWVLFTKNNPLLFKEEYKEHNVTYNYWFIDSKGNKIYEPMEYEHGYAVYTLLQNGLKLAKELGKNKIHVVNYDYSINKKTILYNDIKLDEYDCVFYSYDDNTYEFDSFCSGFLSGRIDSLNSFYQKFKSKKEYYANNNLNVLSEKNLCDFYTESKLKIFVDKLSSLKKDNLINREGVLMFSGSKEFNIF